MVELKLDFFIIAIIVLKQTEAGYARLARALGVGDRRFSLLRRFVHERQGRRVVLDITFVDRDYSDRYLTMCIFYNDRNSRLFLNATPTT